MATGLTTVSAANLCDASGNKITAATAWFQPVLSSGQVTSFELGGDAKGVVMFVPVSTPVVNGQLSLPLADTTLTTPLNVGFAMTVIDNLTGEQLLGFGYGCIQPFGPAWSLDSYAPPAAPSVSLQPPVTLTIGTITLGALAATITGTFPNYTLNLVLPAGGAGGSGGGGLVLVDPATGLPFTLAVMSGSLDVVPTNPVLVDTNGSGNQFVLQVSGGDTGTSSLSAVPTSGALNPVTSINMTDGITGVARTLKITNGNIVVA